MKKLTICFALALLTFGVASAQDTMQNDNMKADASKKAVQVTGKVSDDGKTFVSDTDSKSWSTTNPDAVKGHEAPRHPDSTRLCGQERSPRHVAQDGEVTAKRPTVVGRSAVRASEMVGRFWLGSQSSARQLAARIR
jgi:hypothetical protein